MRVLDLWPSVELHQGCPIIGYRQPMAQLSGRLMDQVLQGESTLPLEGTGVKLLELGRFNVVLLDGLEGIDALVSEGM